MPVPVCCLCTIHHSGPLNVPRLTVNTSRGTVEYRVEGRDAATTRVLTGYDMFRFGVQMMGRYAYLDTGRTFTTGPAVPGAQYRITAWALTNGRRSAKPAVEGATMGELSECTPRQCRI